MAYPRIPSASTVTEVISGKKYVFQEMPWDSVLELMAEFGDVFHAMIVYASKRGNLRDLVWRTPAPPKLVPDPNADPEVKPVPMIEVPSWDYNVELIAGVIIAGVRELQTKSDFIPRLIDASVVAEGNEPEFLAKDFRALRFADMVRAMKAVLTVNLTESSLGEDLGALFKGQLSAAVKRETDGSTGSSTSPTAATATSPSSAGPPV